MLTRFVVASAPLRLDDPDFEHINDIFDEFGPIPRLCIDYDEVESAKYRTDELVVLSIDSLENLVQGGMGLCMDAISYKLCLIRRPNPTDLAHSLEVEVLPVTPSIGSRIAFQLRNAERGEHIRLYKRLTSIPVAKKLSGNVFEAYCQQRFSKGIFIEFVLMVHMPKKKLKKQPQWHTTNTKLSPPLLEKARKAAQKLKSSFDICPSSSSEFTSGDLVKKQLKIKPDIYYSPAAPNQEGFDPFIMLNDTLYLFQFTDAKMHDIKDFVSFFDNCVGHPAQTHWRFISVIPAQTRVAMKCPVLALYSAEEL